MEIQMFYSDVLEISWKSFYATLKKWQQVHHSLKLSGRATPHLSVRISIYGSNLFCITKKSSWKGESTNETETQQMPKNRARRVNSIELEQLLQSCGHRESHVWVLCLNDAGGCVGDTWGGWEDGSSRCSSCVPPDLCHPLGPRIIQPLVATIQCGRWHSNWARRQTLTNIFLSISDTIEMSCPHQVSGKSNTGCFAVSTEHIAGTVNTS